MKTSLGIWALGPMITRFVPMGYQPEHTNESTAVKVRRAVDGLGDLMDDYEFHYPGELNPDNLDEVREAAAGRPVRVLCASGVRSAIAHRVLHQAGLDSASLSGGMLTLRATLGDRVDDHLVIPAGAYAS